MFDVARPALVVGSGQRPDVVADLDACAAAGVEVVRRRSGGGVVLLEPGRVVVVRRRRAGGAPPRGGRRRRRGGVDDVARLARRLGAGRARRRRRRRPPRRHGLLGLVPARLLRRHRPRRGAPRRRQARRHQPAPQPARLALPVRRAHGVAARRRSSPCCATTCPPPACRRSPSCRPTSPPRCRRPSPRRCRRAERLETDRACGTVTDVSGRRRPADPRRVALGGDDLLAPAVEDLEQPVGVGAERGDDATLHVIGRRLDLLAQVPAGRRDRLAVEVAATREAFDRAVELVLGPAPRPHPRLQRLAAPGVGEHADLARIEVGVDPGRDVAVAAVLAHEVGRPPERTHRIVRACRG